MPFLTILIVSLLKSYSSLPRFPHFNLFMASDAHTETRLRVLDHRRDPNCLQRFFLLSFILSLHPSCNAASPLNTNLSCSRLDTVSRNELLYAFLAFALSVLSACAWKRHVKEPFSIVCSSKCNVELFSSHVSSIKDRKDLSNPIFLISYSNNNVKSWYTTSLSLCLLY